MDLLITIVLGFFGLTFWQSFFDDDDDFKDYD